jgi:hypothetical protein
VGGQIGGTSMLLLQIGSISPLTHRHTHAAEALVGSSSPTTSVTRIRGNITRPPDFAAATGFQFDCVQQMFMVASLLTKDEARL